MICFAILRCNIVVPWMLLQLLAICIAGVEDSAVIEDVKTVRGDDRPLVKPNNGCVSPTSADNEEQCVWGVDSGLDLRHIAGSSVPILVIDDFLDEAFLNDVFETVTKNWTAWGPRNPEHQKVFPGIDSSRRLFRPEIPLDGFPGVRHNLTAPYEAKLLQRLQQFDLPSVFQKTIDLEWNKDSFFGNVCYDPEALTPLQSIPHTDRGLHHITKFRVRPVALAMIHYINPNWNGTGGTAFYMDRHTATSSFVWKDCDKLRKQANLDFPRNSRPWFQASGCHCERSVEGLCEMILEERGEEANGYTNAGNDHYELVEHVPYRFNRAVLYAPQVLHSAYLNDADAAKLSCVPNDGRLTANVFLS